MKLTSLVFALAAAALSLTSCASTGENAVDTPTMNVHFLEIVTPEVDATCGLLETQHGVTFSDPVPEFGNSRTAELAAGGTLSVRAPMHEQEGSVVRPYLLVEDIDAAVAAAEAAGAQVAMAPMEIPGRGRFAIYFLGGIQHGVWQN